MKDDNYKDLLEGAEAETKQEEDMDLSFTSLVVEAMDEGTKEATIVVIDEGEGSSAHYPGDRLMAEAGKFAGTKMYIDHLTPGDEAKLGGMPRSVKDWVSTIRESGWDPIKKAIVAKVHVVQPWFWNFLKEAKEDIGVSINAQARVSRTKGGGREKPIFESFTRVRSVDWVTQAGRGGRVLGLLEAAMLEDDDTVKEGEDMKIDWSKVTSEQLKEEAPELYKELVAVESDDEKPVEEAEEVDDAAVGDAIAEEAELTVAEVRLHRLATATSVSQLVEAAVLPAVVKSRVIETFKDAVYVDDTILKTDVAKVIESNQQMLKELGLGRIKGMGNGGSEEGPSAFDKAQKALLESLGYSKEDTTQLMELKS